MPSDLLDNLDYDGDSIRNIINGMNATLRFTNSDGEEEEMELGPIERVNMSTSSSGYTLSNDDEDDDVFSFTGTATGTLSLQPQANNEFFNLQNPTSITVPCSIGISRVSSIDNPIPWDNITSISASRIEPLTRSSNDRIADLMEDYIRNRNQDDKIFINHNTCQREIEYNSIDDVIEFREYLDNIIKEHYQGR